MAAECFLLPQNEVPKDLRYLAKGNFVFAEFFGSYFVDVARSLWDEAADLVTKDGTPIYEHLAAEGITGRGACIKGERRDPEPGTFEGHIKAVDERFWKQRFRVYDQWRRDWWALYKKRGWLQMVTGFVYQGPADRNQVLNTPIQGSAFHCLLWALIRLHHWLREHKFKSRIIGQVHDSLVLDVFESELPDVLAKLRSLLIDEIRREWKWLIIPLDVECEVGVENWWAKQPVKVA
jgi:hypothetical protein